MIGYKYPEIPEYLRPTEITKEVKMMVSYNAIKHNKTLGLFFVEPTLPRGDAIEQTDV